MQVLKTRGRKTVTRLVALIMIAAPLLAACGGMPTSSVKRAAFTSAEFGVGVSPRVTTNPNPPRGGGRYLVGKPYTVRGVVYTPSEQPDYAATGVASWYGWDFHGRRTSNGEIFSANAITAAHPTLPLPSYVRVTNPANGRSILVRVNDRGPFMQTRIIDLSLKAATMLDLIGHGTGEVQVRYVAPAPLNGDDTRMLMASLNRPTMLEQGNTRYAMADATTPAPVPNQRPTTLEDITNGMRGLFSYADPQTGEAAIFSAHAAVNAMATRATDLQAWVAATDDDARKVRLELGTFTDGDAAIQIAERFAMLGAVDEDAVDSGGRRATRLTLTHLKPGVARTDVLSLARELGLNGLVIR